MGELVLKQAEMPVHLYERDGKMYCWASGELDKLNYDKQCSKCVLKNNCTSLREHKKNIAGDWHGLNRDGLYGKSKLAHIPKNAEGFYAPTNEEDAYLLKELRSVSKIVGLALCVKFDTKVHIRFSRFLEKEDGSVLKVWRFDEVAIEDLHKYRPNPDIFELQVASPDGWVDVLDVWPTGRKPIIRLESKRNGEVFQICASYTHPIEVLSDTEEICWRKFEDVRLGDYVYHKDGGWVEITNKYWQAAQPCYDLSVAHPNHRFYADGFSVHNCYGGSAYTVASNMGESVEQAQEKIDAFFSELPDLKQYMDNAKKAVVQTGFVYNLFGRSRSVKSDLAMGWKGRGYAERTALNHPIQSTAADFMKVAMIRLGDNIQPHNPVWGLEVPQELDKDATVDFSMVASVHDELLYFMKDSMQEELIPQIHVTMQCEDVMQNLKTGYSFEMDCEMDSTRSWTAAIKYDAAKIYLLRYLQEKAANPTTAKPNGYVMDFNQLTKEVMEFTKAATQDPKYSHPEGHKLAVVKDGVAYHHDARFTDEFVRVMQEKYNIVMTQAEI